MSVFDLSVHREVGLRTGGEEVPPLRLEHGHVKVSPKPFKSHLHFNSKSFNRCFNQAPVDV